VATDVLTGAQAALERHDWHGAHDAAVAAASSTEGDAAGEARRLDVLAEAAWWLGHLDECIAARERAYALFDEIGDGRSAGMCSVWLYEHYCFKGRRAIASGWLRRGRRALEGDTECAAYGALVLREAEEAHGRGDLAGAAAAIESVVALGRRLRSPDVEAEALQAMGRVLIDDGDPVLGLAHLDEAMLLAVEGRLGPYSTGKVFCSLVSACEGLGDLRRAAEWSEATSRWSERHPDAVFPGLCRVHVASALRDRGEFARAEEEAARACSELEGLNVGNAAAAWAEIGEVRRRTGDFAGAEAAFRTAEEVSGAPQPGLALLRLAQGRLDAAAAIIKRALDDITWNRLARARLLPAAAQIALASGDLAAAAEAAAELEAIAGDFASPALSAAALSTRGRVQLASDDSAASATLRRAADAWRELDVPYEVATARMLQGVACRRAGDDDGAAASIGAAQAIFERLGATPESEPAPSASESRPLPMGLTEREAEVLRLVATGKTNKDVAAVLFLSEKTVSRHLSNIFTKIGVSSRAAATAFAFEQGIVTPS
jgi:DNA-binding NarL/FixJ family response regulator